MDPSAQRGPAAPAILPHYQSVDTATIPLDFGQAVPVPLGFPAHFQVTGQSGQTELHEPVLLRFINAFPPGTRLTPAITQDFGTELAKSFFKRFDIKIEHPEDVIKICRTTHRPPESGGQRRAPELHSTGTVLVRLPREDAKHVYATHHAAIAPRYITTHDEQTPCGLEIGGRPPIPPEARSLHKLYLTHRSFSALGGGSLQSHFRASLFHLYRLATEEFDEDLAPEEGPDILAQLTEDLERSLNFNATEEPMEQDGDEDVEDETVNLQFSAKSLLRMFDFHSLRKKGAYSTTIEVEYVDTQITSFLRDIFGAGDCRLAFPLISPRGLKVINMQVTAQPPGHQVDDASDAALHSPDELQDFLRYSLILRQVNLADLESRGLEMPSLEELAAALEGTLDDERSLPRLLAISGWLKPLLPTDHPDLIAPDRKAYPVSINKSSKVGTKGLLVLGDSSATFEEAGGLLASMSSPAAALQLLLMHHINVRFTVEGTKLMPAAALSAINFPGKNNKRRSIAQRARRAQGSVYITLIVGSYFGSRMKSFNAKLSNREERQAFVKSKIPILFPPSTEPPPVAPPQPQGVPSPAAGLPPGPPHTAGQPPAQAPPPPSTSVEGGAGLQPPQGNHASTSAAQVPPHAPPAQATASEKNKRTLPGADDPNGPNADLLLMMQNFNSMPEEAQLALMQRVRQVQPHDHARKASRLSDNGQGSRDPPHGQ